MRNAPGPRRAARRGLAGRLLILALGLGLLAGPGRADTRTWTGAANSNWFDAGNWAPALPGAGDAVIITNAGNPVLLTSSTPDLVSLTLSNKTLTVSNGATRILASNVCIQYKGTITVASVYATNGVADYQMSNQVYIDCTNFILDAGGAINADYLGFAGGTNSNGSGPGGGASGGGGGGGGGGGHGGQGGNGNGGAGGSTNDAALAPTQPGSGGGYGNNNPGANGGGLVTIQAAGGRVTINGTVTANGATASTGFGYGGGGAGGGIYISCATFSGSSTGLLSAAGGDSGSGKYGGGGGGGRIAVNYTSGLANPAVRFNVERGAGFYDTSAWNSSLYYLRADKGTVSFPDLAFLNQRITEASGLLQGITGYVVVPSTTNWSPTNTMLIVTNAWIGFLTNFTLSATNLTLEKAGTLHLKPGNLNCASNLTVTNGGTLYIYSQPTNGLGPGYGALVSVGSTLRVATNGAIYPVADPTNGGAPSFQVSNLVIAAGGQINANGSGYAGGAAAQRGYGTGGGDAGAGGGAGGGGHGGRGGKGNVGAGGEANDATNAPTQPGSGGGGYSSELGGNGGGLVTVQASGTVSIDGTVTANGATCTGTGYGGGGAGGGIYISCTNFGGSSTGRLSAAGGNSEQYGGGGAGGRIAVWVDVPPNIRTRYINSSGTDGRAVVWTTNWPAFSGTLSVSNGAGVSPAALPGTVFFFKPLKGAHFAAY